VPNQLLYYKEIWNLEYDGESFATYSGLLQPALFDGNECMLKIARRKKDTQANELMIWWQGEGAAKVLRYDQVALLMERAKGGHSLNEMVRRGHDTEASRILSRVVARLHTHRPPYPDNLVPLKLWFTELPVASAKYGGIFTECSRIADSLLDSQQDIVALHGDIHHGNVLDFGERGWLAIDPKGLVGERGFDYANIFCNPDAATATQSGRLMEQAAIVAAAAGLDQIRLLGWIASWAGLSASWCINDKEDPQKAMSVAKLAIVGLRALTVL
jgi:streptomycin 6-kinase